jgi:hypothetical protein
VLLAVLAGVVTGWETEMPWPSAASLVLAFMAGWWRQTISPRVELHQSGVLVVTYNRKVGFSYGEVRRAEFDGSYFTHGRCLRIVGRTDRVTVWPGGGLSSPSAWQVQFQAELQDRIRSHNETPSDPATN